MNNENIARLRKWKYAFIMAGVSIITMIFGGFSPAYAGMQENIRYTSNILYINKLKHINIVNIYNIINNNNKKKLKITNYLVIDLDTGQKFKMPAPNIKIGMNYKTTSVYISRIVNAIKSQETGGEGAYTRHSYSSSACGAYQYMPQSWNNYMGYKTACLAPSWVQDQRMIGEIAASYKKYHNWEKAIAAHLLPSRAGNVRTWNLKVPGNPTVRQYVDSVMAKANIQVSAC